jgi:hypothetical protein
MRSVVKRVEFISNRMSYKMLTGHCCDILLRVQAATEDKRDDTKDRFYKEVSLYVIISRCIT